LRQGIGLMLAMEDLVAGTACPDGKGMAVAFRPEVSPSYRMNPSGPELSPMVWVARCFNREEADAFAAMAAECGVSVRLASTRQSAGGFDATLGGADHLLGFSVRVKASDVPVLRAHLESSMEADPLDPLNTASDAELLAMTQGPLEGNLCEQIIAAKLLAGRPEPDAVKLEEGPVDVHLSSDRRVARWLGAVGLIFLVICYCFVFTGFRAALAGLGKLKARSVLVLDSGFEAGIMIGNDAIAHNLRPFILTVIPMAAGTALILSKRQLRNGTTRPMFPPLWRTIGYFLFWLPALLMGGFLLLAFRPSFLRMIG